jgi:uncharacterized protein involved in exopolysaccharide biosynthesis
MRIQLLLKVLRRRWRLGFAVWAGSLIAIVLATCLGSWQYSASSAVLVESKVQDSRSGTTAGAWNSHMPTEIEVLRSERVALRAMRSLSGQEQAAWRMLWQQRTGAVGSFDGWVAERLLSRLDVWSNEEASVLTIAYTSADRTRAASLSNAFMQAYIDVSEEVRREAAREYGMYFAETAGQLRANLEAAQGRRARFQMEDGLVSGSESLDTHKMHLSELKSQVVALEAKSADNVASELLARARAALADQRAKVLALTSLRDHQDMLDREVDSAQRALDAALNRYSQISVEGSGARRNVSVLKKATPAVAPSWPNVPLVVGAGGIIGLLLAVFATLLRERADGRLRMAMDAASSLGLRVVALLEDTAPAASRQARIPST